MEINDETNSILYVGLYDLINMEFNDIKSKLREELICFEKFSSKD